MCFSYKTQTKHHNLTQEFEREREREKESRFREIEEDEEAQNTNHVAAKKPLPAVKIPKSKLGFHFLSLSLT